MDEQTNRFLIPGAIVLAAIVIAIAVIYSINGPSAGNKKGNSEIAALGTLPEVSLTDFILGDKNAPVTMIEYGDFQCPFCGRFFKETESTLREKYIKTGKIKFIYRDFAFLGPESTWAANAARCAGEQGKFWEYHDRLFGNQQALDVNNLKKYANELKLDSGKFDKCLDDGKYRDEVNKDLADGSQAGIDGTPGFIIGKTKLSGAQPYASFKAAIDAELSK